MDGEVERMSRDGLAALERRVRDDLAALCYPPKSWIPPTRGPDGETIPDVVIIGAGMCGLAAGFALLRAGIRNLRILDRAAPAREGPWVTYARMDTLRSPKELLGPASGLPSLTFRAWYTARHGEAAWQRLDKIPRPMWMDYLVWYRHVLELPVENGVSVERIEPDGDRLVLVLSGAPETRLPARRVVLATGREGLGAPTVPGFMAGAPRDRWAHSSEDIDFAALRGRRVVVIGAGASAVENAATALEAGAAEVRLLARRTAMPQINKMMGIGSYGLTFGFPALPDEWRWRYMHYNALVQTPAPRGSTLRVSRHPGAHFHFGVTVREIRPRGDALLIATEDGRRLETEFVILGTGFDTDPMHQPVLAPYADNVLQWRDRYAPPPGLANDSLARFPYLARDFSFAEREPGRTPWLGRIHCFNYGARLSLGNLSGDIPAVSEGAAWLAREMAARFYAEDIETHWQALQDYATPELRGDEWTPSDLPSDPDNPQQTRERTP